MLECRMTTSSGWLTESVHKFERAECGEARDVSTFPRASEVTTILTASAWEPV